MIKIIASISMIIDHIGIFLFPYEMVFRAIGRLAFPLFALQIAISCDKCRSIISFQKRLGVWGIISQVPYALMLLIYDSSILDMDLNVMFTFLLAVFLIYLFKEKGRKIFLTALVPILAIAHFAKVDYGVYGVVMVLGFYFLREKFILSSVFFGVITILYTFYMYWEMQSNFAFVYIFAILAIPLFLLRNKKIPMPKYFFYVFYPLHLFILWLISNIFKFS